MNVADLKYRIDRLTKNIAAAAVMGDNHPQSKETLAVMFEDTASIIGELAIDVKRIADAAEARNAGN